MENPDFKLKVRLGEYDVTSTVETLRHEDRPVDKIVLHPHFNNDSLINDIALLKLQYPAKQSPHIDVVCVPKEGTELPYQSKCVITGWGRKSEGKKWNLLLIINLFLGLFKGRLFKHKHLPISTNWKEIINVF